MAPELEAREIHTTFVQRLPGVETALPPLPALFPAAAASIDLARLRPRGLAARTAWPRACGPRRARCTSATATPRCATSGTATTTTSAPAALSRPGPRSLVPVIAEGLRAWDVATAARVHRFAANSALRGRRASAATTAATAEVIPPPVDTDFFTPGADAPGRLRPRGLGPRPLQAPRPRARRLPRHGPAAADRGQRARRRRACAPWPRPRSTFLGRVDDERAARALPRLPRRAHARGRGLRHRAPRGHGLRPARRGLRRGRRAGDGRSRARPASSSTSRRAAALRAAVDSLSDGAALIDRHSEPGRGARPRGLRGAVPGLRRRALWPSTGDDPLAW